MWIDLDHAGCIKTRKSVSGGILMAGWCYIKIYSKGQGVVSLSTGEVEYYSLVSGASNLLGEIWTALDWGIKTKNEMNMDASAGISNAEALGRLSMWTFNTIACKSVLPRGISRLRKLEPTTYWQMCLRNLFPKQRWTKYFWVWTFISWKDSINYHLRNEMAWVWLLLSEKDELRV